MLRYQLTRRISHADVDFLGELKVPALLGLLEQTAIEASTAAGFDAAWYTRAGRIWIIRRTRLERFRTVGGGDTLEVDTEVVDVRRVRSLRRYAVRRDGTLVAQATTDWVYCDLRSGRPTRIPETLELGLTGRTAGAALSRAQPLPANGTGPAVTSWITVQPSHLDHVAHVNNAIYASFLEDGAFALFAARAWPLSRMLDTGGALRVRRLDIEYLSDALAGEQLAVSSWQEEAASAGGTSPPPGARLSQAIRRADGSDVLRAQSDWVWRLRPAIVGGTPPD